MNFKFRLLKNQLLAFCIVSGIQLINVSVSDGQNSELNNSINQHRKGEIVVQSKAGATVNAEQLKHEFWFGCAISNGAFDGSMSETNVKLYKEKFLENFNSAVTENAVKWGTMERRKGDVDYAVVDAILNWTDQNTIPLRGHNIFWGIPQFVQPWLKEMGDEELMQTLKNRAETLASRYKGRFVEYDLNNEMIHGNYYEDRLGPGITKQMAEWLQHSDPRINLFLNDYDILTGNKLKEYMTHIRLLLNQNVPIAGIGVQGHLHTDTFDRVQLKNALDSLAQFHLPIRITEFNIPGQRSKYYVERKQEMTPEEEQFNAGELVDYYTICFAHPAVEGILMWGFWGGANWIPVSSLYRKDWSPTPAAIAYKDLIYNKWWTKDKGKTDEQGEYKIPAFYGKYKITVNGVTKEVDLTKAAGKVVVQF